MELKEQLMADLKTAMRAKDSQTRNTIRLMQAAIKQIEVDKGVKLDNAGVLAVLMKQAKQRRDSITEYEAGGRSELAQVEKDELVIIDRYLPKMMERAEIEVLVREVLAETGVTDQKGMGKVMGKLMPKVKGKADGKLVNQIVRALLAG